MQQPNAGFDCPFPENLLEFWPNVGWILAPKLVLPKFAKCVGVKLKVCPDRDFGMLTKHLVPVDPSEHLSEAAKNKGKTKAIGAKPMGAPPQCSSSADGS